MLGKISNAKENLKSWAKSQILSKISNILLILKAEQNIKNWVNPTSQVKYQQMSKIPKIKYTKKLSKISFTEMSKISKKLIKFSMQTNNSSSNLLARGQKKRFII